MRAYVERVQTKRLDYSGHFGGSAFFLQYGTTNKKSEVPAGEVNVEESALTPHL